MRRHDAIYFDVHVPTPTANQLRRRGVDILTAQEDGAARLADFDLLVRRTAVGRVLFTQDIRFKARGLDWQREARLLAGLIFGHRLHGSIGQYVCNLELIAKAAKREEWIGRVEKSPLG